MTNLSKNIDNHIRKALKKSKKCIRKVYSKFRGMSRLGQVLIISVVLVIISIPPVYASTDGFCLSDEVHKTENELASVNFDIKKIKTSTLEQDKTSIVIQGKDGTNKVTYDVTTHCERVKSKLISKTQILTPVINGQVLIGTKHTVKEEIDIPYTTDNRDNPDAYVGTNKLESAGINGKKEVTYSVAQDEGQPETKTVVNEVTLKNPVNEILSVGVKQYEFVQIKTYPLSSPGRYATLTASTLPNSTCNIVVNYSSGPSVAKGLYTKTADNNGDIQWTWFVGTRTSPGTWPIKVTCNLGSNNEKTATSKIIVE